MGTVKVNFADLESAISDMKTCASNVRSYGDALKNDNFTTLENIQGGINCNIESAYTKLKEKNQELIQADTGIADRLDSLAAKLQTFRDNVKIADSNVKDYIETEASTTQTNMGVSSSVIENFWFSICDGVRSWFNQSEFGQMISSWVRQFDDWLTTKWEEFQLWYKFDGGEFVVNIGLAVLAIAVGIFTICTAGVGFLAVVAIIGAVCGIINAVAKIVSNVKAWNSLNKGDPAWAYRLQDNKDWVDYANDKKKTSNSMVWDCVAGIGHIVNVIDTICAVIQFADFSTKIADKFRGKQGLFQKYLGSQGYVDHMTHRLVSEDVAFNTDLHRWVKIGDNGEMTKDIVDFRYKSELLVDCTKASFAQKWNALKTAGGMAQTDINKSIANFKISILFAKGIGGKEGASLLLSSGVDDVANGINHYFKGDTSLRNIMKTLGSTGVSNMGLDKISGDLTKLRDAKKYYEGKKYVSGLMNVSFAVSSVQSVLKVVTNFSHLATCNFDDLSSVNRQLSNVKKKLGGFGLSFGTSDDWYGNWNEIFN